MKCSPSELAQTPKDSRTISVRVGGDLVVTHQDLNRRFQEQTEFENTPASCNLSATDDSGQKPGCS